MIRREGFTWLLDFAPGKGGSAPPPPDPYATSAAQTQSNQQTAAYNAAINRGNTITPYGSSTYTTRTDPTTGAPTRIRRQKDADGTVERIAVKSGAAIPRTR